MRNRMETKHHEAETEFGPSGSTAYVRPCHEMEMMNVLFVHECFGAHAGAEANLFATATELRDRGHTVGILHGAGTGKQEMEWADLFGKENRFPLGISNDNGNETKARETRTAMANAIDAFAPSVIYLHKLSDLTALEALADCGVPVVRMVHDHEMYCMRGYKYHPLTRQICRRPLSSYCVFPCGASLARNRGGGSGLPIKWVSYSDKKREVEINRRFARMVVATDYMRKELLLNRFDPARIEICAPVPKNKLQIAECKLQNGERQRTEPTQRGDGGRLIWGGQIIRGKGVDVLLESLTLVQEPFECFIFGEGGHREYCEGLCHRLHLEDRVHFMGYVSQTRLGEIYSDASVMLVSSVWPEPFGAVGLEAMHRGLPVVAFDAGGIGEWLIDGENGFLVPWMDRAGFARRVGQLLRDKELARQMGAKGQQMVCSRYDFASYVSGLESTLKKVAHHTEGSPQPVLAGGTKEDKRRIDL